MGADLWLQLQNNLEDHTTNAIRQTRSDGVFDIRQAAARTCVRVREAIGGWVNT
jgi:hypothetical protein